MKNPVVSIVMCVRNTQEYIDQAVKSILSQSFHSFEFIIVDDASNDSTFQRLKKFQDQRLVLLRNIKSQGVAASLNRGLRNARGKFVARMDGDDIALPQRLEIQVKFLNKHPQIGVVGSWVRLIDELGKVKGFNKFPTAHVKIMNLLPFANPFIHPSVMIRHELIKNKGQYDVNYDGAEDYEMWLRFSQHTRFANIPKVLLKYRLHQRNISFTQTARLNLAYTKVQLLKISEYRYPWWHLLFVVKSLAASLLPRRLTQFIYSKFFNYS